MKPLLIVIGLLSIVASIMMKIMSKDAELTDLHDYWWYPLLVAQVCFLVAGAKTKEGC